MPSFSSVCCPSPLNGLTKRLTSYLTERHYGLGIRKDRLSEEAIQGQMQVCLYPRKQLSSSFVLIHPAYL